MKKLAAWLSDLKVAIVLLLLLIALASGIGTAKRCCGCSSTTFIPAAGFWA